AESLGKHNILIQIKNLPWRRMDAYIHRMNDHRLAADFIATLTMHFCSPLPLIGRTWGDNTANHPAVGEAFFLLRDPGGSYCKSARKRRSILLEDKQKVDTLRHMDAYIHGINDHRFERRRKYISRNNRNIIVVRISRMEPKGIRSKVSILMLVVVMLIATSGEVKADFKSCNDRCLDRCTYPKKEECFAHCRVICGIIPPGPPNKWLGKEN
ncbi:unnamed protein product, partial [Dovyalis caffra]